MDERARNVIDECKRQEESCLYTSTALYEWLKFLAFVKLAFVVAPILLGAVATWQLLDGQKWVTGLCALAASVIPAVYKALDFDVSLTAVKAHAHQFKVLQDRFRQAWRINALGEFEAFKQDFDELMDRMDAARSSSLTPPERFFKAAQQKVAAGDYSFTADAASSPATPRSA